MQSIKNHNSIEYINDSKGTNVDAAIASISSFKKKIILLAGGQSKGGNFEQFAEAIKYKVKRAYLFGEDAKIIGDELNKYVPVIFVDNLEDAVILAKKSSLPGDIILLSPACASFDQFNSFIHRGKEFERIVGEITK
jgi:UDP-N-acetylmuramoylalanine--D-glutamate ligase